MQPLPGQQRFKAEFVPREIGQFVVTSFSILETDIVGPIYRVKCIVLVKNIFPFIVAIKLGLDFVC